MEQAHDVASSNPGSVVEAGPAAEAKRLVGTIEELWRYPVKSMLGGTVRELLITEHGGLGDRAWALRDQRNGRIVSAKRVPRLLEFRATYEVEPTPESAGVVRIETPDGGTLYAGQDDASARISGIIGRPVVLDNLAQPDEKASIDRNTVFGDVPVSQMKPDWTPETMPDYFQLKSGSFLEIGAVFLLASGTESSEELLVNPTAVHAAAAEQDTPPSSPPSGGHGMSSGDHLVPFQLSDKNLPVPAGPMVTQASAAEQDTSRKKMCFTFGGSEGGLDHPATAGTGRVGAQHHRAR